MPIDADALTLPAASNDVGAVLSLHTAIRQALAFDPKVRQTWAAVARRSADIGVARAAYFPSIDVNAAVSRVNRYSRWGGQGEDAAHGVGSEGDQGINMSWLLLDFGSREARLNEARSRLAAASATQDASLQQAAFDVARAYYAAFEAQSLLRAARVAEQLSLDSVAAACARHEAGAGTLADVLQARTAHARSELTRLEAVTSAVSRMGVLAAMIGADMNTVFRLDDVESGGTVDPLPQRDSENMLGASASASASASTFSMHSIDELLALARHHHPALRAASAEVHAERSRRDTLRYAWAPSVTLVGGINRETRHGAFAVDGPVTAASIGIRISIPLYDGGDRRYRTAAANALVDVEQAKLAEAERGVAMAVWQHYQALRALSARGAVEQRLLADARQSFEMARGRYREGAGTMEALVTAQTALADAEHVIVASRARWQTARLRLAISIGQLDVRVPGRTLGPGFSANASPSHGPSVNSSSSPSPDVNADFGPTPPASRPRPDRESGKAGRHLNTPH